MIDSIALTKKIFFMCLIKNKSVNNKSCKGYCINCKLRESLQTGSLNPDEKNLTNAGILQVVQKNMYTANNVTLFKN